MIKFEDFRIIRDHIDYDEDLELYKFLTKNIEGNYFNKIINLLKMRARYVDDSIKLSNPQSTIIDINLDIFINNFNNQFSDMSQTITDGKFKIHLDYPEEFYYIDHDSMLIDTVKIITYNEVELSFKNLELDDKKKVFDKLPIRIIQKIQEYCNKPILLMDSKFGMDKIEINVFNNSGFEFIKLIYDYYTSFDILETVFLLSKRFTDITYINTRTPKEITQMIKLYSEEVAKMN